MESVRAASPEFGFETEPGSFAALHAMSCGSAQTARTVPMSSMDAQISRTSTESFSSNLERSISMPVSLEGSEEGSSPDSTLSHLREFDLSCVVDLIGQNSEDSQGSAHRRADEDELYHPSANMDASLHLESMGRRYKWLVDKEELVIGDATILGEGTVGTVFKGHFRNRVVAIKVLKHQDEKSPEEMKSAVEDLRQETRIASMMEHPNIVKFYGAAISDREPMIVYEYMSCGTLEDFYRERQQEVISKRSWLTVPQNAYKMAWRPSSLLGLKWCNDLMSGIAFLHGNDPKIIHRDIKPSNLFLNGTNGSLKIGDMGLCTFAKDKTENRHMTGMTGSLRYMAPEVYSRNPHYDESVDVFSASLVMYFILTGQRPYEHLVGHNVQSVVQGVAQGRFRPHLKTKGTRDFPEVQQLLTDCWNSDPKQRPTAETVVARLTDIAENRTFVKDRGGGSFGSIGSKVRKLGRSASKLFSSRSRSTIPPQQI
eukprot:CAMPEP_0184317004 /NCGR_PEP_ID=MMETSP1049-20130417/93898_1 /TAXON_ID=77928 /ORGANISM="Proteomonas sulcata, Strain CCMP704" /LENGTH=483 /DNA_ID=CAMNT_0026636223 /DNA_START=178 /DNA_END=1629 /DNA_ORIENTATION=-